MVVVPVTVTDSGPQLGRGCRALKHRVHVRPVPADHSPCSLLPWARSRGPISPARVRCEVPSLRGCCPAPLCLPLGCWSFCSIRCCAVLPIPHLQPHLWRPRRGFIWDCLPLTSQRTEASLKVWKGAPKVEAPHGCRARFTTAMIVKSHRTERTREMAQSKEHMLNGTGAFRAS